VRSELIIRQCKPRWEPVLADRLCLSARDAIAAVAADVDGLDPETQLPFALCECALLFAYMALSQPSGGWEDRVIYFLNSAIAKASILAPQHQGVGLYGGLAGVGWIVEHVSDLLGMADNTHRNTQLEGAPEPAEDPIADIDLLILRHLERGPWIGQYDLISGLVGLGIYFLERLPREPAIRGIRLVLTRLEELAKHVLPGITWFTPPQLLPKRQLEVYPAGYYNLGVAHGVPGVVQFLGEVLAVGIETARAKLLLEGSS